MGQVEAERLDRNEKITSGAPPAERDMLEAWLQHWDLPPTAPLAFYYSPGEVLIRPAPGLRAETVYTPCSSFKARTCPWKFQLASPVANEVRVKHVRDIPWPDEDPAMLFIEVRFRIWKPGTPTFVEVRLDPDTWDTHMDVRDLDERTASTPKKLKVLLDAVRTHIYNKPGPKEGSVWYPDADDFLMRCVQAIDYILEWDGNLVGSQLKVARVLAIDPKTLRTRLQDHGLPSDWKAFVAYVLKFTSSKNRLA
jgi:hypothetical protein